MRRFRVARDTCPSPYGQEYRPWPVARGPVPRDRSICAKTIRSPEGPDGFCHVRSMARDRPSPYGRERGFPPTATKTATRTVARGPVPRDHSIRAKTVRSPRGPRRFLSRSQHGEGQALALRTGKGFSVICNENRPFHRSAGACPPRSLTQTENRINDRSNEQF